MSNTRRQNQYEVACEISGLTAMWTRPDTGDAPVSDSDPTPAAVKDGTTRSAV